MPVPSATYGTVTHALVSVLSICIDPAGIIAAPDGLHEQWPRDTTMPTWARPAVVVLTSVTLNGMGGPPGRTVVGPGAVMVTSTPPADPCDAAPGAGEADEVPCGGLDDADCPAVVVAELVGVPELVAVWELEQPTKATTVAAPTNVAANFEAVFMMPSGMIRGGGAAEA